MNARTGGERRGSLLIDLAARTAVVDGARVELPRSEFTLLATLAAGPGRVFPTEELVRRVWPDDPVMNADDLRWRIWHLRKRIGDGNREQKVIGNRHGIGYFVNLPAEAVQVIQGPMPEAAENDAEVAENPALEGSEDSGPEAGSLATAWAKNESGPGEASTQDDWPLGRRRSLGRPGEGVLAAVIVSLLLGGSWAAGYWLSQRGPTSATGARSRAAETAPERGAESTRSRERTGGRNRGSEGRAGARTSPRRPRAGSGIPVASQTSTQVGAGNGSGTSRPQPSGSSGPADGSNRDSDARAKEPPPRAPQPSALLYHLFNPESGDHFMTTSSSAASRKQAEGYDVSTEGRVFSKRVHGTTSISVNSGSAFVYRDAGAAPEEVNVSPLYSLTKNGDFFHTVSSSLANQAQAQGWTRSTSGYVAT